MFKYNFGSYPDSFKPKAKEDIWNECDKLYNDKKYFESYKLFFEYLNDDDISNVKCTTDNNILKFEFIQGSKEIRGFFDGKKITAISKIAEFEKSSIPVFRQLLEVNFSLYYSRFAITDNIIVLRFDSSVQDCNPEKLYFALRELSIKADRQGDIITTKFKMLKNIDGNILPLNDNEFSIYKKYLFKWVSDILKLTEPLNKEKFSGGMSYLYLNTFYRIMYFLTPHSSILNDIELLCWNYFNDKETSLLKHLDNMEILLKKLLVSSDELLRENFYRTQFTFGISPPASDENLKDTINKNIGNYKWYYDNNYQEIALRIFEYISSISLFNYSYPDSIRYLLGLIMNIINNDFVSELYPDFDLVKNNTLQKDLIIKEINEITTLDSERFDELKFNVDKIIFDNKILFVKSMYEEFLKLSYKDK